MSALCCSCDETPRSRVAGGLKTGLYQRQPVDRRWYCRKCGGRLYTLRYVPREERRRR